MPLIGPAAIASPLLIMTLQNPTTFNARTENVAALTLRDQLTNLRAVAGMLTFKGEDGLHHNVPGRPLYDPALSVLFVSGLAVTIGAAVGPLRRRLGLPSPWEPIAVFTLAWFIAMLLPTQQAAAPHIFSAPSA